MCMKIDLHFLPTLSNIDTIFVRITPCESLKCSKVTGLQKIEKRFLTVEFGMMAAGIVPLLFLSQT